MARDEDPEPITDLDLLPGVDFWHERFVGRSQAVGVINAHHPAASDHT
jgi:hypothetical protein